jgi:hypothetical protein
MSAEDLEALFPGLRTDGYTITSAQADRPNCIGWVLRSPFYFDPVVATFVAGYYWPEGVRRDDTVEAWCELFALHGYVECDTDALEAGVEKIAVYASSDGDASHVARQLPSGEWTSKIGKLEDIQHRTLASLRCEEFATVVRIMKRSDSPA